MNIVMVDDSPADRSLCRTLLEVTHGPELEFSEADTAAQGLATCRAVTPDCVLIDDTLPDMTGLEFLESLRSSEDGSDLAVVVLAAMDSGEVAAAALKAGAQDYLLKDRINAEALNRAIQEATQRIKLARTLRWERDRLASSLAAKETLLKEVHHRIKNNLQVIASLLRLQTKALEDERLARTLWECQRRVESMALIHEQLFESEDLRELELGRHAARLTQNLFQSYGIDPARIAWRVALGPLRLSVDQAMPVGLILNELVSNALEHAFPEGRTGSVAIEGGLRDGRVVVEVRDDGVGIPAGVEPRRPTSLGLEIVNILTRQLKGTFELDRSQGTTFRVSFQEKNGHYTQSAAAGT